MNQQWNDEIVNSQDIANTILRKAQLLGATQAEVDFYQDKALQVTVRQQEAEVLEHHQSSSMGVTVYIGKQKGVASTNDMRRSSLENTVEAAYRIAKLTQADEANGLADPKHLANNYPALDLHHPWPITPLEAIELAKECEAKALSFDKSIIHSEGVGLSTGESMRLYANTNGFMGHYLSSRHSLDCTVVARDEKGNMQRDGSYTTSRDKTTLKSIDLLSQEASERTIRRLNAKRLKTQKAPVIFDSTIATSLIKYFLQAISGRVLYQKASFLLDQRYQPIFPDYINIQECPYETKGLGSLPFDAEGVAPQTRYLVKAGLLEGYLLNSYSARRLKLETTGNASGFSNIKITTQESDLKDLLSKMQKGLLVTEVIGHGINLVTGDYSQGAAGFWIEQGKIQYPVEEITIAGNLRDMYRNIVSIAGDLNLQSSVQTGSILVESMTIAGE